MAAIRLEAVWKQYPRWGGAGRRTVRSLLAMRVPLLARRGDLRWVLRDVSVAVEPGGSVGVIGRNGAGKSTLLRIAAGLSRPSRGAVAVPDGVAAVLSLGEAFDPSLTGRENAFTSAVLWGWSRNEARALVREALEFGELEAHADAPVRTYSEGMKLRLAFGVLAQLEPEALLVDEVIAVGDLAFQAKCMEWIAGLRRRGTTLMLASHDLRLVERECERAIWLEDGAVGAAGDAGEVVAAYEEAARARTLAATPPPTGEGEPALQLRRNRVGTQEATIERVRLTGGEDAGGQGPGGVVRISPGDSLRVSLELRSAAGPLRDPIAAVAIHRAHDDAVCVEANTRDDAVALGILSAGTVTLTFERLDLTPGRYLLDVGLYRADWDVVYDFHWHAIALEVGEREAPSRGAVFPPRRWELEGGG